jgi:AraC-like DNA-binding protein
MKHASHTTHLYGDLSETGARVLAMDEQSDSPIDWKDIFTPGHGHLILNLGGYGVVFGDQIRLSISPGIAAICRVAADEKIYASRLPGSGRHRFLVLSTTQSWIAEHFGSAASSIHPLLRNETDSKFSQLDQLGQSRSMSLAERDLAEALIRPPVSRALRPMWFRGKLLECFSLFGSEPLNRSGGTTRNDEIMRRIDEATLWLREHFNEDLDLKLISRHVGCAPHYLSRLFRLHTGKTLSQKLRQIRIDQAADLLHDGKSNVTEAALEVGYSSLSHFSKAFLAEKGVLPSNFRGS